MIFLLPMSFGGVGGYCPHSVIASTRASQCCCDVSVDWLRWWSAATRILESSKCFDDVWDRDLAFTRLVLATSLHNPLCIYPPYGPSLWKIPLRNLKFTMCLYLGIYVSCTSPIAIFTPLPCAYIPPRVYLALECTYTWNGISQTLTHLVKWLEWQALSIPHFPQRRLFFMCIRPSRTWNVSYFCCSQVKILRCDAKATRASRKSQSWGEKN